MKPQVRFVNWIWHNFDLLCVVFAAASWNHGSGWWTPDSLATFELSGCSGNTQVPKWGWFHGSTFEDMADPHVVAFLLLCSNQLEIHM